MLPPSPPPALPSLVCQAASELLSCWGTTQVLGGDGRGGLCGMLVLQLPQLAGYGGAASSAEDAGRLHSDLRNLHSIEVRVNLHSIEVWGNLHSIEVWMNLHSIEVRGNLHSIYSGEGEGGGHEGEHVTHEGRRGRLRGDM